MQAVVAALFMNIYIVGLNQLFDIEIDKVFWIQYKLGYSKCLFYLMDFWELMFVPHQVNKPTLPLASGEYTPATGVAIVSIFAAMVIMLSMEEFGIWFMFYFHFPSVG